MKLNAACTTAVLALLLAGVLTSYAHRDYRDQSLDLLRLLATKPWSHGSHSNRNQEQAPRIDMDLDNARLAQDDEEALRDDVDDDLRASSKRSAVATALNSGRRRRQPTPALGKAVTSYVGVGVLNDVGSFFDSLRDNLETLASLSPAQRSTLFQEPPTEVVAAVPACAGSMLCDLCDPPATSDLTTADHSWRRTMLTRGQTTMTLPCCGLDSADKPTHQAYRTDLTLAETPHSDTFDPQYLYLMPRHRQRNVPYTSPTNNQHSILYTPSAQNQLNVPYTPLSHDQRDVSYTPPTYNQHSVSYTPPTYNQHSVPYTPSIYNQRSSTTQHYPNTHKPLNHQHTRSGTLINLRDLNVVFDEDLTLSDIVLALQEYCSS